MIRGLIILEDMQFSFTVHDARNATVTVCDGPSGREKTIECSCDELGASLALAMGSDEIGAGRGDSETLQSALYALAEPLQARLRYDDEVALHEEISPDLLRIIP